MRTRRHLTLSRSRLAAQSGAGRLGRKRAISGRLNDAGRLFTAKPTFEGVSGRKEDTEVQQAIDNFTGSTTPACRCRPRRL